MTDKGAAQAERDREEAMEWAMTILSDPKAVPDPTALDRLGEHQAAFAAWASADPTRKARYLSIVHDMLAAGDAAARTGMRSRLPGPVNNGGIMRSPWALAASLAFVLVAAAAVWWRSEGTAPSFIAHSEARTPLETRVGEVRTEWLADGSSILLDTDTLLLVTMTAKERSVEIKRGRARFTIVQDTQRPFTVHGAGTQVIAEDGSFDMTARDGLRLNPIEGELRVIFTRAPASDQPRSLKLHPGQLLLFKTGQGTNVSVISAPRSEQQWVTGVKSFDNVPVSEVIAEANSYSEKKIELATPALGSREIFADIEIRDIERVAQAISAFLELGIERSQPNKLILSKKK